MDDDLDKIKQETDKVKRELDHANDDLKKLKDKEKSQEGDGEATNGIPGLTI